MTKGATRDLHTNMTCKFLIKSKAGQYVKHLVIQPWDRGKTDTHREGLEMPSYVWTFSSSVLNVTAGR